MLVVIDFFTKTFDTKVIKPCHKIYKTNALQEFCMKIYLNLFLLSCLFFNPHTNFCCEFEESQADITIMSSFEEINRTLNEIKKSAGPEWITKYYSNLNFIKFNPNSFPSTLESCCARIPEDSYTHFNFEQLKTILKIRNEKIIVEKNKEHVINSQIFRAARARAEKDPKWIAQQIRLQKYIEDTNRMQECDSKREKIESHAFELNNAVFVQSLKRRRNDISRVNQQYQDQQSRLPLPGGIASKRIKFAEDSNLNEMFIIDHTLPVSSKSDVV